jgi:hypothetical protein
LNDQCSRVATFAGRDEVQTDPLAGPVGHRRAGQLGAVVAAQHARLATHRATAVLFVDEVLPILDPL